LFLRLHALPETRLVTQHYRQSGAILGIFQDAFVNRGFAAGHDPCVDGLVILNEIEFPMVSGDDAR
jgi:hypothetical protein